MKRRNFYFTLFMLGTMAAFAAPLEALLRLSYDNDAYSHVALIPLISVLLIYFERRKIFACVQYSPGAGAMAILAGLVCVYAGREHLWASGKTDPLTLTTLAIVLVWTGGFVGCYGIRSLRAAAFPALFLLLMVPLPDFILNRIVFGLQKGSTEVTYAIFRLVGVPVLKQGFVFSLPGVSIQVARECSGIRSGQALLITSLLAGHYFLRAGWRKLSFSLMVIPITIFKNAIRIATISLLSVYVDRGFLTGRLHRDGGIPFSMIAIAMLIPLLWWLQKSETHARARLPQPQPAVPETAVNAL